MLSRVVVWCRGTSLIYRVGDSYMDTARVEGDKLTHANFANRSKCLTLYVHILNSFKVALCKNEFPVFVGK